jgi:hypothetical protein
MITDISDVRYVFIFTVKQHSKMCKLRYYTSSAFMFWSAIIVYQPTRRNIPALSQRKVSQAIK